MTASWLAASARRGPLDEQWAIAVAERDRQAALRHRLPRKHQRKRARAQHLDQLPAARREREQLAAAVRSRPARSAGAAGGRVREPERLQAAQQRHELGASAPEHRRPLGGRDARPCLGWAGRRGGEGVEGVQVRVEQREAALDQRQQQAAPARLRARGRLDSGERARLQAARRGPARERDAGGRRR